ncbi:choline kinase family protein [Roseospira navarrensis]|uniref:Phosphotransferase n=1 Tax=Roseospira navarrensis TaxID=140058 RepID=A0A7X1ZFP8_9PROT|nr:choline kinase family protein [Roseospira navarrensis]MQX37694.1 phosphotransferase [Roseospira navarrensis]
MATDPRTKAAGLAFWSGPVDPQPLGGGMTNANFVVEDGGTRYVVRIGDDIPVHQVLRFNELAASRAAEAVGISPPVVHHEPGALVLAHIDGTTLTEEAVRDPAMLARIVPLIQRCHREIPKVLRGPALVFWVFHSVRDYAWSLRDGHSAHLARLPALMATAARLEGIVGPVEMVYGHNDLLPGNLIDDGERLWLIDWDYGGFNSPLFDLGGLASNNQLAPNQEEGLLEAYFERTPTDDLRRRFHAMKCASLLREAMWSMISELHSDLDIDYAAYTAENLARFDAALDAFNQNWG